MLVEFVLPILVVLAVVALIYLGKGALEFVEELLMRAKKEAKQDRDDVFKEIESASAPTPVYELLSDVEKPPKCIDCEYYRNILGDDICRAPVFDRYDVVSGRVENISRLCRDARTDPIYTLGYLLRDGGPCGYKAKLFKSKTIPVFPAEE